MVWLVKERNWCSKWGVGIVKCLIVNYFLNLEGFGDYYKWVSWSICVGIGIGVLVSNCLVWDFFKVCFFWNWRIDLGVFRECWCCVCKSWWGCLVFLKDDWNSWSCCWICEWSFWWLRYIYCGVIWGDGLVSWGFDLEI